MRYISIFTFLIFTVGNLYAQHPDCTQFKNGKFQMTDKGNKTIIVREGNKQLEYFNNSKKPVIFTVSWKDDCTYTLTPSLDYIKSFKNVPKNALLTCKISMVSNRSYTVTTTANFTKFSASNVVYKID
jgi:hypothetical protein